MLFSLRAEGCPVTTDQLPCGRWRYIGPQFIQISESENKEAQSRGVYRDHCTWLAGRLSETEFMIVFSPPRALPFLCSCFGLEKLAAK